MIFIASVFSMLSARARKYVSTLQGFLAAIFMTLPMVAHGIAGQPGTLDATWGANSPIGPGKVLTQIAIGHNAAYAMAIQPDGRVLLAGTCTSSVADQLCVVRYAADGTLDTTFGNDGKILTSVSSSVGMVRAIALLASGKVLLAGSCSNGITNEFCVVRYNADGTLDLNFGVDGKRQISMGTRSSYSYSIALQPDQKFVLSGICIDEVISNFCAVRFDSAGTLDISFGVNGKAITSFAGAGGAAVASFFYADGKLLQGGWCTFGTTINFCLVRYHENGVVDTSFGTEGRVVTTVREASSNYAHAMALQPDGKVLLAGDCSNGTSGSGDAFCAVRYETSGDLDSTFGTAGKVIAQLENRISKAGAISLMPDGAFILAGACIPPGSIAYDFCAARFNSNGILDLNFGANGFTFTAVGTGNDRGTLAVSQRDGKLLLAGTCSGIDPLSRDGAFCIVRYDGGPFGYRNCSLDIDGDGLHTATIDGLIITRVGMGMTGESVIGGITFPANAVRNTWPLIREHLIAQCGMSLQ